jgi:hypothetical protein
MATTPTATLCLGKRYTLGVVAEATHDVVDDDVRRGIAKGNTHANDIGRPPGRQDAFKTGRSGATLDGVYVGLHVMRRHHGPLLPQQSQNGKKRNNNQPAFMKDVVVFINVLIVVEHVLYVSVHLIIVCPSTYALPVNYINKCAPSI